MFTPVSPEPSAEARELYRFIQENFGKKIISGAQECPDKAHHELEVDFLEREVGVLPLIRGFDFIHDDYDGVVERAKAWHSRGGIVTICWHTGILEPTYPASKEESPDFSALFDEGSELHSLMIKRWERGAKALSELQAAGVPVLYRPFHEFDGGWFWWSKGGPEAFKRLWRLMFEKFTGEYDLRNLLWVLGYSGDVKPGWYPGDEYVDVAGSDNYDATTNARAWTRLKAITQKPLAFHEVGYLRDISEFFADGAPWSWFMNWHTKYLIEDNGPERLKAVYADPRVIKLK